MGKQLQLIILKWENAPLHHYIAAPRVQGLVAPRVQTRCYRATACILGRCLVCLHEKRTEMGVKPTSPMHCLVFSIAATSSLLDSSLPVEARLQKNYTILTKCRDIRQEEELALLPCVFLSIKKPKPLAL